MNCLLLQSRFLSHEPTENYADTTWHVPYNVWVQGQDVPETYTDVLLESQSQKTILLDNADYKLALINVGQTGEERTVITINLTVHRGTNPYVLH